MYLQVKGTGITWTEDYSIYYVSIGFSSRTKCKCQSCGVQICIPEVKECPLWALLAKRTLDLQTYSMYPLGYLKDMYPAQGIYLYRKCKHEKRQRMCKLTIEDCRSRWLFLMFMACIYMLNIKYFRACCTRQRKFEKKLC